MSDTMKLEISARDVPEVRAEMEAAQAEIERLRARNAGLVRERDEWREKALTDRAAWADENSRVEKAEAEVERLKETLNDIASWSEGETVNGTFDEPWAAKRARAALAGHAPPAHEPRAMALMQIVGPDGHPVAHAGSPSVVGFDANGSETP